MQRWLWRSSFSAFNKELLAKQVWRIILSPNSLMERILKAHYFRNVDIMNVGLGNNPSFIWKSLLWSQELLKKLLCWRVGNRQDINAFSDSWIPSIPSFRIRMSTSSANDFRVSNLIKHAGSWDESLVRQMFTAHEAVK